jgi:hypothetical protein
MERSVIDEAGESRGPVVDFSAHLYPEPIYSDFHDGPPVTPEFADPDRLDEWYNGTGVDVAVLSQP